ncbi:MAG: HAMP domain-containing sensor histidine kinase [Candidatus Nanopelagicales bacterium]
MRFGLRTRVALATATLSLVVAGAVAGGAYAFARWYLLEQRQSAALTRAVLDSRAVDAAVEAGASASEALAQVPTVGTSQSMLLARQSWFTSSITISPDALPADLMNLADTSGAQQRLEIGGDPYFVAAIPVRSGTYVEVFPLRELDRTLTLGGWALLTMTFTATAVGALLGASLAKRILVPLQHLGVTARRITDGELSARIALSGDADLDPLARSFNKMADAVQLRIARERRFAANVSHELRSPLTSIAGTTELLEAHKTSLPSRDAQLITVLAQQVQRMSRTLLDLLEISRLASDDPVQWESTDLNHLCREIALASGCDPAVVNGDTVILSTDARRIERIVGNLLDNAQIHGGGATQLAIQREPGSVRIIVEDAGPGIPVESRDRLLEPFTRGSGELSTVSGAGLGLAIAREQTQMLGGTLKVSDSPSGGARFIVILPLHPEST